MVVEEYGRDQKQILVMLHGAHMVHCFSGQYPLADRYHLLVPHLMGFGDEAGRVFDAEACVRELGDFIGGLRQKVLLVGFSLGAQLAYRLVLLHPELFSAVILASPWLIKEEASLRRIEEANQKQLRFLQKEWVCRSFAAVNGIPKALRKDFIRQIQAETPETIHNVVYNGIALDDSASRLRVPVIALAGEREPDVMRRSVEALAQASPYCRYEIWEKAGHSIPMRFPDRFNRLICDTAK